MKQNTTPDFDRLIAFLRSQPQLATASAGAFAEYQQFLERFSPAALQVLTLDQYCVGKGDGASFCWWLERGLEPLLGRYMPGTARGHLLYFKDEGQIYKHRSLKDLSDEQALRYVCRVHAAVASVKVEEDWRWIDDDEQIYQRAGVPARVTMANGRKLRLLAAYHPQVALPIASSQHLAHFLEKFGCPLVEIPPEKAPVARMLKLREYYDRARGMVEGLTTVGFMKGLYAPELGIRPAVDHDPDDGGDADELFVELTQGAINNGYIRVPRGQKLFPERFIAADEQDLVPMFALRLPGEVDIETCLLGNRGRIKARFNALFAREGLVAGDIAVFRRTGEAQYSLLFERGQSPADVKSKETRPGPVAVEHAMPPLNQILYGPPGTGKTYATVDEALRILDHDFLDANHHDRTVLKRRFDALVIERRIRFVTFHQSFSYEDFVEGLRAETNETKQLEYKVDSGVFKRLCDEARTPKTVGAVAVKSGARVWKISIDGTGMSPTKAYCLSHGEARIGWGKTGDLLANPEQVPYYQSLGSGDQGTLRYFAQEMAVGDVLLCIHSADAIGAVGVVTGDYRFEASGTVPGGVIPDYQHVRPVKWLYKDLTVPIGPINDDKQFTLKTVYQMQRFNWAGLQAYLDQQGCQPEEGSTDTRLPLEPYVLIIDEINRGNTSRIFGELITLIEPSKRAGAQEALEVQLPYSKAPFSVPPNVHIIGTMNTADRSLAGLDVAMRRRFVFKELPPRPELLRGVLVDGVDVERVLEAINQRIEALLDREHRLGHAYFTPLLTDPSLDRLADIFRNQVLPLLQEYFFDDWQRIQWVLNDHRKPSAYRFVIEAPVNVEDLFGPGVDVVRDARTWRIQFSAFGVSGSYQGIIGQQGPTPAS